MTSRVRRHTFTTNHRRGNAGSPTPSHTTKTRAGPSASLGDDPSSLPLDTPPIHLHTSAPTCTQTDGKLYDKDYTHPIWEVQE